jgi:hypothetical protein
MNTYLPVLLESGRWAIERFADGESRGLTFGRYNDKEAAAYVVRAFERMQSMEEAPS